MHLLFPTGQQSKAALSAALAGVSAFTYTIVPTGEIASFLTPAALKILISTHPADAVVVSGMCTADFSSVAQETATPVFRGTRHAADMALTVPLILAGTLSTTIPADILLEDEKKAEAQKRLIEMEDAAVSPVTIRNIKFGGGARIKVLCEIMDAPHVCGLRDMAVRVLAHGADGIDLGFGFDAEPADVIRCLHELEDLPCLISIDTLSPALIRAGLFRADLVFSVTGDTLTELAGPLQTAGTVSVCIPQNGMSLQETVKKAKDAGLVVMADPLLQPPLSGMTQSLAGFTLDYGAQKIMGCVNVVELIDADSPGVCAILAAAAAECGCAAVLISEHSDKTQGAVAEMRRATEQMQLCCNRPYPKDAGVDVFVIKEKRRRHEPLPWYTSVTDAAGVVENPVFDPRGNFRIGIEGDKIIAVRRGHAIRGRTAEEVIAAIIAEGGVSLLDHAAYLGRELYKAELAIRFGRSFEQDGIF